LVCSTPHRFAPQVSRYPDEWFQPAAGTIEDHRKIYIDEDCPKNNDLFDVSWVLQKIVNGYARIVYYVRIDAAPGDHKKFEMTVPPEA
jgi:hypothetical protein